MHSSKHGEKARATEWRERGDAPGTGSGGRMAFRADDCQGITNEEQVLRTSPARASCFTDNQGFRAKFQSVIEREEPSRVRAPEWKVPDVAAGDAGRVE